MSTLFSVKNLSFNFEYAYNALGVKIVTYCIVTDKNDKVLAKGDAICHEHDRFVKSTGRKLALARVLKLLNLDRDDRKLVWDTYFEKVKK